VHTEGLNASVTNSTTHAFVGVNGRTSFSKSPVFMLVRVGYYTESGKIEGVNISGNMPYVGIGVGVDLNRHFNLQATGLRYFGSDGDNNAVQVGLEYRF
jgi:hypothetical protein